MQGHGRLDGDRVTDHAALALLHPGDFLGLVGDDEVAMDEAESALLGHGDGHPRARHGVHGGAGERNIERNVAGQASFDTDCAGQDVGFSRRQKDVIEGVSDRKRVEIAEVLVVQPVFHVAL